MTKTSFNELHRRPCGDTGRLAYACDGEREAVARPWQIGGLAKE